MRKLFLFIAFIFSLLVQGQMATYDTVGVSPGDGRNIHGTGGHRPSPPMRQATAREQPHAALDSEPDMGFVFDKSKLRYGANIGLSFSRNYSALNFGPQVGYQLSNRFMAGVGMKYYYNRVRAFQFNEEYLYRNNLLGAHLFGYFYPARFLALFAQPEINHLWANFTDEMTGEVTKSSGFVPSLLLGGGLRLGRSHITLNYDLAQHTNSPYPRGWFLGFSTFF